MKTTCAAFRTDIEPVRQQLEAWRRTRKHRESIPPALWQVMARLARVHGVSAISRALRVHYYDLRQRVNGTSKPAPSKGVGKRPGPPTFVELKAPVAINGECVIEVEDRGAKMIMRVPAAQPGADPLALIQAFWRR
jgi:hypothetical protein